MQDALLAVHSRFGSALTEDDPLAYARRAIIDANISWSRRALRREVPTERVPDRAVELRAPDDQLWQLLGSLAER